MKLQLFYSNLIEQMDRLNNERFHLFIMYYKDFISFKLFMLPQCRKIM